MLIDLRRVKKEATVGTVKRAPFQEKIDTTETKRETSARRFPILRVAGISLSALILVIGGIGIFEKLQEKPAQALKSIPFTTFTGLEQHPTFSPDGRQIAFSWDGGDGGNSDIYIKLIGEGNPLQLTSTPAHEFSPSWSPDGRNIAISVGLQTVGLLPFR
jgi:dipeptidyl aminopeptidase/acylaminoacyl peptidase